MVSKIRTDNRLDPERPHYYSQYWIDVAMGKQPATLPEPAQAAEEEEPEELEPEFVAPAPKPEPKPKPKVAEKKPEVRPLTSLADLANIDMLMKSSAAMDDDQAPDISGGLDNVPDISLDVVSGAEPPAEASEGDEAFDEEFEEDEEDSEWGPGRRKQKPGKAKRHEPRRDY